MDHGFARRRVQTDALVRKHRFAPAGAAAQQGADARQQLVDVIGLDHVVVGPGVQPGNAVADRVARRGDQDGNMGAPGTQGAQHVQAAAPGQAQVKQHQVVLFAFKCAVGHDAIAHPVHRVMLGAQHLQHRLANHGVVFDQ